MESVRQKLGISTDELNAMYVLGDIDGNVVADGIRARFGIDLEAELADELEARGVLTAEEADYLRDGEAS